MKGKKRWLKGKEKKTEGKKTEDGKNERTRTVEEKEMKMRKVGGKRRENG